VGSSNLERFYDTTDDAGVSDVVLTATAFNNRLNKASLAIRNFMQTPDVVGIEEMEKLSTLQALATKINNDAVAAAQPNPNYAAFLVEGNDVGGIDVGFLVKTARVTVIDVTQFGLTDTYINPNNGQPELLNDRPPLILRATIQDEANQPFAFTVIVNHLRSLNGVDDPADGNRVRTKRRAQAEYLANLVQSRQTADPTEKMILVGDFNAFQFNDGYVDVIGTIKGTPAPADQVVLASSDLVNPDLAHLANTLPVPQRYSYSFGGNAEILDHVMVTSNLLPRVAQFAYARFDADYPDSFRNDPNRPERISDHDAPVTYISLSAATPSPAMPRPERRPPAGPRRRCRGRSYLADPPGTGSARLCAGCLRRRE
jgi:predicted extracellular nuclease